MLFFVGLKNSQNPLIMVNGALFLGTDYLWSGRQKKQVPSLADQTKAFGFH